MESNRLWYMATPYTNFEGGLDLAFRDAAKHAARLLQKGFGVYSPIVHSHPIAMFGGIDPTDHALWMAVDKPFMEKCDGLIVCTLPGWSKSKGMRFEIDWFAKEGKPVRYYDPETETIEGVV